MVPILIIEFIIIKRMAFEIICSILCFGSILTGLITFLLNPGITFKEKDGKENPKMKICNCPHCNFTYPKHIKPYTHCFTCGVCVPAADHHCGVFAKCIANRNIAYFYLFPICTIFNFIVFIISLIYHFAKKKK